LPTTHHHCNLDAWALAQRRRVGHCSLVISKRVLRVY